MGLVKHSAALCIFLKVLLCKLVVVVNKVTIILEETFQRGRRDPSTRSHLKPYDAKSEQDTPAEN